jgi:hypothetical protein
MKDIRIAEADLSDDALLQAWWECGRAAAADRLVDAYRFVARDSEGLVGIASLVEHQLEVQKAL